MKEYNTVFSKDKEVFKMTQQSKLLTNGFITMLIFAMLWAGSMTLAQFIPMSSFDFLSGNSVIKEASAGTSRRIIVCGFPPVGGSLLNFKS